MKLTEWLAANNVGGSGCVDAISGVRLAAPELKDVERPHIMLNMLLHPPIEARLIDAMALFDRLNTGVFLVLLYALRHFAARSAMPSARWRICAIRGAQSYDCGPHQGHPRSAARGR